MSDFRLKVIVPCSKTYEFLELTDIVRCEALQNYTKIFLENGSCIISSANLGCYKKALEEHQFFSCHKSHLINNRKIIRYFKDGQVEMTDTSKVPVARRKKDQFYKEIIRNADVMAIHKNV